MKSRGSSTSLVHIHTAPVVPESKSAKQNTAISRVLKKQAVVEAAGMRDKKIKHFLSNIAAQIIVSYWFPFLYDLSDNCS
jgi:hypothetical protein